MSRHNRNNTWSSIIISFRNIAAIFTIAAAIFFIFVALERLKLGDKSLVIQKSIEESTLRTEKKINEGVDSTIRTENKIDILINTTLRIEIIILDILNNTI